MRIGWLIPGVLGLAATIGCQHKPAASGASGFRFVEPPAAAPSTGRGPSVLELGRKTQYREARPVGTLVMPVYPARPLAARAGRATVGVHVTVNEHGAVTDIRTSIWVMSMPGPFSEDFRTAVDTALRQWRFTPAETLEIEQVQQDGFIYDRVAKREAVPTEFDLAFDFTPDGKLATR